jgi:glycosyltransferase involved in cell wall biosynthesis
MRIAVLTSTRVPGVTAHGQHISQLVRALVAAGHAVTLSSRDDVPQELRDLLSRHVSVEEPTSRLGSWGSALRIRAKLRGTVDLVYALDVRQAATWGPSRLPLVLEVHSLPVTAIHRWIVRLLVVRRHWAKTRLVAISRALAERHRLWLGGVDVVCAPSSAMPSESLASRPHWFASGEFNVAYVGSLYEGRGLPLILALANRHPGVTFHVIGGDQETVNRWSEAAPPNVRFYGHRPNEEVQACYKSIDVGLAPYEAYVQVSSGAESTHHWMSPMKIVEYFAFGVPVIASDLPAIRELVVDDRSPALLRPPGDLAGWSEALTMLREDPGLRRSLHTKSLALFRSELSWPVRLRRMLDHLI